MDSAIDNLVKDCKDIFGENLICILLIGSVQKEDSTPFSDIDLIAIIKTFQVDQMRRLRQLIRNSEKILDFSFLCRDEISTNPNEFRIGTHGCYQLELILKKAKCLYGKNILLDTDSPSNECLRRSILDKIIQYTWWARRMFVESNRERSLENNYQLNSRLIKMISDFIYLSGTLNIHLAADKVVEIFLNDNPTLLSNKEANALIDISKKELAKQNTSNMSDEYFEVRFSIVNKLHKAALELFKPAT